MTALTKTDERLLKLGITATDWPSDEWIDSPTMGGGHSLRSPDHFPLIGDPEEGFVDDDGALIEGGNLEPFSDQPITLNDPEALILGMPE